MIGLTHTGNNFDVVIENGKIVQDSSFLTMVTILLFTDARADDDDDYGTDKRGNWLGIEGSKLWLLLRSKITSETLEKIRLHAQTALNVLIEDALASNVEVEIKRSGNDDVTLTVIVDENEITFENLKETNS